MQKKFKNTNDRMDLGFSQDENRTAQVLKYQKLNFILVFMIYASAHACRTGWSEATSTWGRDNIQQTTKLKAYQGYINMTYLLMYASGKFALGGFAEVLKLKRFLSFGLIIAACCLIMISFFSHIQSDNIILITFVFMGINGFFQSVGMPGCISTLGNWFSSKQRGQIIGLWAGCQNLGDILGFVLGGIFVSQPNPWEWGRVLLFFACLMMFIAFINLSYLQPYPKNLKITDYDIDDAYNEKNQIESNFKEREKTRKDLKQIKKIDDFTVRTSFIVPGVVNYIVIFSCVKSINYGLLFWLPSYLNSHGKINGSLMNQSGYISAMVDIGAFIGGYYVGKLSDRIGKRMIFLMPMMAISSVLMFITNFSLDENPYPYYFIILGIGLTFGGCYNIIGSTITLDLAKQPMVIKNPEAKVIINSVINGSAAVIAGIYQQLLKVIGGDQVFLTFMITAFICTLLMFPMFKEELNFLKSKRSAQVQKGQQGKYELEEQLVQLKIK